MEFGTLYIKPAFVFVDDHGSLKLQFEADSNSAHGYLYDNLCQMLGLPCRAAYGCGPDAQNTDNGGFCPQMTLADSACFHSEDHAARYLESANNYVDYWRSLYPSGVAVGTTKFCPDGGCLGLFLNRYDLYDVFRPDDPTLVPGPAIYNSGNTNQNTIIRGNGNVNVNTFTRKGPIRKGPMGMGKKSATCNESWFNDCCGCKGSDASCFTGDCDCEECDCSNWCTDR